MSACTSWLRRTLSMRARSTLRILPRRGSTACVLRSRPCLAEPPAESPSTMKISLRDGSFTEQSASLPGRREFSSALLRRVRARALRAADRARGGGAALRVIWGGGASLADDLARVGRVLLEELRELLIDDRGDEALHARVAELRLRLALELRVGELGRDDRSQALADVLPGEVVVLLLQLTLLTRVAVERPRERRAEARHVR